MRAGCGPAPLPPPTAAATQGPGLADALHGAPALLAGMMARSRDLRRMSKACCEAVDGAAKRCRLDFASARRVEERRLSKLPRSLLERMAARLAKLPILVELLCVGSSGAEVEQLLTTAAAAQPSSVGRVERLMVKGALTAPPDEPGSGLPALLRSLAHLPSLQVCCWLACIWAHVMCVYVGQKCA